MSDETGDDLDGKVGDLDGLDVDLTSIGTDFGEIEGMGAEAAPEGGGSARRLAGVAALLLGVLGVAVTALLAAAAVRAGFDASGTVDQAMEPVEVSFDRMEIRIDETDDLVDRDGIAPERVPELRARVDGLVDVSTGTRQAYDTVEDNPIYGLLPADLAPLGEALAEFEDSSNRIHASLATTTGDQVSTTVARNVAGELDDMQASVSDGRELIADTSSSLRRGIRLGSLLGFVAALVGLWGQVVLARRGWRGVRGRPV